MYQSDTIVKKSLLRGLPKNAKDEMREDVEKTEEGESAFLDCYEPHIVADVLFCGVFSGTERSREDCRSAVHKRSYATMSIFKDWIISKLSSSPLQSPVCCLIVKSWVKESRASSYRPTA